VHTRPECVECVPSDIHQSAVRGARLLDYLPQLGCAAAFRGGTCQVRTPTSQGIRAYASVPKVSHTGLQDIVVSTVAPLHRLTHSLALLAGPSSAPPNRRP
jgi:hypothetical protein